MMTSTMNMLMNGNDDDDDDDECLLVCFLLAVLCFVMLSARD